MALPTQSVPQRLKPERSGGCYGTAEAVPLTKTVNFAQAREDGR
jgi:hypothetical protein